MRKSLILLFILLPFVLLSQDNNFTILCVAAHPDDEDGATLAYYSKLKGYKAYTIFYTRGEGGQNEIGPELYDELGRLREQECYDAAAIQGSTAYFLGLLDFGFSKTAKETFKFWGGEDSVLARIVYMIRVLRPDVIITNHDTITTKPFRQHGHHQVCGITSYLAFDKAADPNYHPEQLVNGVTPWQVKKLFFRYRDSLKTGIVEINVSERDHVSGKTIAEINDEALSRHRTQGMDKVDKNSVFFHGNRLYQLVRSDKQYAFSSGDLFSGIVPGNNFKPDIQPVSYPTLYSYITIKTEDSLRILNSVKYNWAANIGLVKTYDNTMENILKTFGIRYDTIPAHKIKTGSYGSYSTVILDIRAYQYRPELAEYNKYILEYIQNGGNVVCFYHKPQDWNDKGILSPYPIWLSSARVTEEDSEVKIIRWNRILSVPNEITAGDWNGWVQERSVYLPSDEPGTNIKTSSEYERLLAMNDEGDPAPPTSLLWARYGNGTYTYCALALYRQLKIFNEGALKLFMNLIAVQANWDE